MHMSRASTILMVSIFSVVCSDRVAASEGDAEAGKGKAMVCAGCHGDDGNSAVPAWPKLAGQQPAYLVKQLQDFKVGIRVDPMMSGVAVGLLPADMQDIAAWYASQAVRPGPGVGDLALGESIYMEGRPELGLSPCAVCHGDDAKGHQGLGHGGFPALAGQQASYTAKQLHDFRDARRDNDYGDMMSHIAGKLSPEEIDALAAWLETLP